MLEKLEKYYDVQIKLDSILPYLVFHMIRFWIIEEWVIKEEQVPCEYLII